jgi:hypothetical protein
MEMINFTPDELVLIERLCAGGGWDDDEAAEIRGKIRSFLFRNSPVFCCYCGDSMFGWHKMAIDTEHILPKAKASYKRYSFELKNLNLSCKRCNMGIKRSDDSFYSGGDVEDPFKSEYYSIVHPNLDQMEEHLELLKVQRNRKFLVRYTVVNGSTKGATTRRYFRLEDLEIDLISRAQGLEIAEVLLPPEIKDEIDALIGPDGEI